MTDRDHLEDMNAKVEQLEREGRDQEARVLTERANALARRMFREASRA